MDPRSIVILPFGILPLVLLAAYIAWKMLQGTGQRLVTNDRRFGETEFPTIAASLLCGLNKDELSFSEDGQRLVVTVERAYRELPDAAAASQYVQEHLRHRDEAGFEAAEQLTVSHVERREGGGGYRLTLAIPRDVVLSRSYIESEMRNLGRVFIRNLTNEHRWLLPAKGDREVEWNGSKALVRISRVQLVPTMLANWTDGVMSERQITRNIKNRLWNLVDVRCVSIDAHTYVGEIAIPSR